MQRNKPTPIRCKFDGVRYILTAGGIRRTITAKRAHRVLSKAGWPYPGENRVLWRHARPVVAKKR
jgi:hypothetical protein